MLLMFSVHSLHRSEVRISATVTVIVTCVSGVLCLVLLRLILRRLPGSLSVRVALDAPTIKGACVAGFFALTGYSMFRLAEYLSQVIAF
jgi:hypothetical protein